MFGWSKARRRKRLLAQPFPRPWQELLHDHVWQYRELNMADRNKLHACTKVIVAEMSWEGCDGLVVNDTMRVTIAGQASLMLLGTDDYFFDGVRSILVFPQAFRRKTTNGLVMDTEHRAGEAWQGGPIVLSWEDVRMAVNHRGDDNLVIHEFAHHLDGLDGHMGGTPLFDNAADQQEWARVMAIEYEDLCRAADQGHWTILRHYGAKSKAEFFAVASECFFEIPFRLRQTHLELYQLLRRFYRIDPVRWSA